MAKFYQTGNSLDYNADARRLAGAVVKIGNNLFGIAERDIAAGDLGALSVSGVYAMPKGSGTIAAGAVCFWDAGNSQVTTTPVANGYLGRAVAAASVDTVLVLLNGTNIGDVQLPEAQDEPTPTATDVTATVTAPAAATNAADVTVTGTYADDDDAIETAVNANRADIAALITWAGKAKTDITALAAAVAAINDDLAAVVAKLKTAGLFE